MTCMSLKCSWHNYRQTDRQTHSTGYTVDTFWKIRRKSNFTQVGIEYTQVNCVCARECSCSPCCNKLEPDRRRRHDRPTACLIAQQYCAATFTSQCCHSCKEKSFARFKNVISVFHFFLCCLFTASLYSLYLFWTFLTTLSIPHITKRWMTVCSDVIIGILATLWAGQRTNLLIIPGGHKTFLSPYYTDRLWRPPIFLLSGCRG
jgi:hypothetical protein